MGTKPHCAKRDKGHLFRCRDEEYIAVKTDGNDLVKYRWHHAETLLDMLLDSLHLLLAQALFNERCRPLVLLLFFLISTEGLGKISKELLLVLGRHILKGFYGGVFFSAHKL